MSAKDKEVIIVWEPTHQSWLNDLSTYAVALGLILPGWFLGSSAMQWLGVLIFFIATIMRPTEQARRFSVEGAKKRLSEIEAEVENARLGKEVEK